MGFKQQIKQDFKKGSSGNLVAVFWDEIEFAAVEENSEPVVFEASESPCCRFDCLDSAIESFCSCVGYTVAKVA